MRDDNILVRGRKGEVDCVVGVTGVALEGSAGVVLGTTRVPEASDAADWDRDVMGGIKF